MVAREIWSNGIEKDQPAIPREQLYWLYEMMHAIRDNLKIDLRESAAGYFSQLPVDHLAGHYPAPYPASENEYRVPIYAREWRSGHPRHGDGAGGRARDGRL